MDDKQLNFNLSRKPDTSFLFQSLVYFCQTWEGLEQAKQEHKSETPTSQVRLFQSHYLTCSY